MGGQIFHLRVAEYKRVRQQVQLDPTVKAVTQAFWNAGSLTGPTSALACTRKWKITYLTKLIKYNEILFFNISLNFGC